jgi:hypothetical protein
MDQLFDATRGELETSNIILSIALDEALSLCKGGRYDEARERAPVFRGLFDRLSVRLCRVIRTIEDHGSHFGTLPNVKSLSASNFRGGTAQRISIMSALLGKVVFHERTRFFHKLYSLVEIIEGLQEEARGIVGEIYIEASPSPDRAWQQLEVLGYDLNTCMGETTVLLKSFFCALPPAELESFRQKLVSQVPALLAAEPRRTPSFHRK